MASLVMKDELFDAQFVRALSCAAQQGADLGECVTSNYHRTSGFFLLRAPIDERLRTSTHAQTEAFRRAG